MDGATNGQNPLNKTTNGVKSGLNEKLNPDFNASAPLSTVLEPNDLAAVPHLLERIKSTGANISSNNDSERRELLAQARHLVQALETPRETMIKHCWAQVRLTSSFGNRRWRLTRRSQERIWPSPLE